MTFRTPVSIVNEHVCLDGCVGGRSRLAKMKLEQWLLKVLVPVSRDGRWGWDGACLESVSGSCVDPISYRGGVNLYEYVGDGPTNATDPLGELKVVAVVNNYTKPTNNTGNYIVKPEPTDDGGHWARVHYFGDWSAEPDGPDSASVTVKARGMAGYENYNREWKLMPTGNGGPWVMQYVNVYEGGDSIDIKKKGTATCKLTGKADKPYEISATADGGEAQTSTKGWFGWKATYSAGAVVTADVNADNTVATFHVAYAAGAQESFAFDGKSSIITVNVVNLAKAVDVKNSTTIVVGCKCID